MPLGARPGCRSHPAASTPTRPTPTCRGAPRRRSRRRRTAGPGPRPGRTRRRRAFGPIRPGPVRLRPCRSVPRSRCRRGRSRQTRPPNRTTSPRGGSATRRAPSRGEGPSTARLDQCAPSQASRSPSGLVRPSRRRGAPHRSSDLQVIAAAVRGSSWTSSDTGAAGDAIALRRRLGRWWRRGRRAPTAGDRQREGDDCDDGRPAVRRSMTCGSAHRCLLGRTCGSGAGRWHADDRRSIRSRPGVDASGHPMDPFAMSGGGLTQHAG